MAKILIVDDDPDVVDVCRIVLEGQGHSLEAATNRSDGMKNLESFQPDLMILDVMMEQPDDGIQLAQEIRRKGIEVPIIMLTSVSKVTGTDFGQNEDLVPVNAFFEKPIEPDTLIAKVNDLLGN